MAVRTLSRAALALSSGFWLAPQALGGSPPTCTNSQLSCQNTTAVTDTCCFNAPGGLFLLTQFWDTNPPTGPSNHWTVHGLWPDNCDGTYDAYCDNTRSYQNVTQILQAAGKTDLLSYMSTYWKDMNGVDETFWEHEWNKHGTCISTLEPRCYTGYTPQKDVVDYFQKTIDLFKTLDSYAFLSAASILPSTTQTYTSSAILSALAAPRNGLIPAIYCKTGGVLDEIWYFYNVQGSVQTGTFVPAAPDGSKSDCPATGIRYLPKGSSGGGSTTTSSTGTGPTSPPSGGAFSGKGTLPITTGGQTKGCIISGGTWYTTGTCATFTATLAGSGFTLTSSKGKCAVSNNVLTCGSSVTTPTVFTSSNGQLAYAGSTAFYASAVPSGSTQASVSVSQQATSLTIGWVGV